MPGHRFFVEPDLLTSGNEVVGTDIALSEADSHHARTVLRIVPGEKVTVILKNTFGVQPAGARFAAEISGVDTIVHARVLSKIDDHITRSLVSRLLFALCKGERNDLVCEKATELGVATIHFFQAQRSVVRVDTEADAQKKIVRWNKIAEAAAKQCNRAEVPSVMFSRSLSDAIQSLERGSPSSVLFCSLASGSIELRDIEQPSNSVTIVIGPEGDFSPDEESLMLQKTFTPVTLGPLTLRSETAAISAVAMANAVWGFS